MDTGMRSLIIVNGKDIILQRIVTYEDSLKCFALNDQCTQVDTSRLSEYSSPSWATIDRLRRVTESWRW